MAAMRVLSSTSTRVSSSTRACEPARQTGASLRPSPLRTVAKGVRGVFGDVNAFRQQVSARSCGQSTRSETKMAGTGKFIVGGNWKCNGSTASITQLISELNAGSISADVDIVCGAPFVYIPKVQDGLNAPYQVAAQNCWIGDEGAFTGEVSAGMLKDIGVNWVILGHSERRALCGETNEVVGQKVAYALSKGLSVILCCGETLEEREAGTTLDVCYSQLQAVADQISDWSNVVVAYEPIWAIGTGKVATPDQAQEVHAGIRKWFAEKVSPEVSSAMRIQYGGSVNAGNCETLAAMEDIDGFLVGGASLKGPDFVTICNSAQFSNAKVIS